MLPLLSAWWVTAAQTSTSYGITHPKPHTYEVWSKLGQNFKRWCPRIVDCIWNILNCLIISKSCSSNFYGPRRCFVHLFYTKYSCIGSEMWCLRQLHLFYHIHPSFNKTMDHSLDPQVIPDPNYPWKHSVLVNFQRPTVISISHQTLNVYW